jgi:hypothetical protein
VEGGPEAGDAADFAGTDDDLKKLIAAGVEFPGTCWCCRGPYEEGRLRRRLRAPARWVARRTAQLATSITTDLGNARRLVKLCGKDLRWTKGFGDLVWEGIRWAVDATEPRFG